jgi:hypothetical protein
MKEAIADILFSVPEYYHASAPRKALDSSGCNSRHCAPACAGLLLGGTCDKVLTVNDS